MSYFFIINPNAGKKHTDIHARIAALFSGRKISFVA